jgi:hypothetical protein
MSNVLSKFAADDFGVWSPIRKNGGGTLGPETSFITVFVGIETPEIAAALKAIRKEHNAAMPMMEAIRCLYRITVSGPKLVV